ncbi:MAG: PEP-CTERM sorting domain-containing protein [Planctomycetota bacterium]|nr:PEP-CTERM sorting domain-containing protein [Planctomycetota bacterium]
MIVRTVQLMVAFVAMLVTAAGQVQAALLIDAGPSSILDGFFGGNYVAGSEFTTSSSLTIRSLGWLDAEGDGLLFNHQVGLWGTGSQTLLASAVVTPLSPTIASANGTAKWFMENITPFTIEAGTYRIAGLVGPNDHNALSDNKIGNGVTISAGYVRTGFPNGGFNFPGLTFDSEAVRATLSTDFVSAAAVPEPTSLAIFGIGACVAGLGAARRLRREKQ